jgi:hypothetical protein
MADRNELIANPLINLLVHFSTSETPLADDNELIVDSHHNSNGMTDTHQQKERVADRIKLIANSLVNLLVDSSTPPIRHLSMS